MQQISENSNTIVLNNLDLENTDDLKTSQSKVLMSIGDEEQNKQTSYLSKKISEKIFTYLMCFIISYVIGYSFTSYGLIVDHSLRDYSQGFYNEYHEFFKNLCPAVLYFGSFVGTLFMLMIKEYSHLATIQISLLIFFIGYLIQIIYPHILMIFLSRFLIGIASGVTCMIIPQVLYFNCKEKNRGLVTSFFPFFIMIGLTSAVALMSLVTPMNYSSFTSIPLLLLVLATAFSYKTFELINVKKEKNFIEVTKFMFQSSALKSTISVILTHVFQKTTGVDFIGNFSGSLFTGDYALIYSITPLLVAAFMNIFTGCIPDRLGRKLPIVANLSLICLITLSMAIWGTNVISLILFTIVYNAGLGSVPYYYQNEIVPEKYIPDINEIGTFSNILLALAVALYAAFLLSPSNTTIWYTFSGLSIFGAIIMTIIMPETKGTPEKECSFMDSWINLSFKNNKLK